MRKLIDKNKIIINGNFQSKTDIFKKIAELAFHNKDAKDQKILEKSLIDRENQISTGLEKGFAIPHAISETVAEPAIYIITNKNDISWKTIDNTNKVKYIFCLLVPKGASDEHLKLLAALAVKMNDEKFCDLIKKGDITKIIDTINNIKLKKETPKSKLVKSKTETTSEDEEFIIGVTSCAAGVAHTYMAKDKLVSACEKNGWKYKFETRGTIGPENVLTKAEIKKATLVVIASDLALDMNQFKGKKIIEVSTNDAIRSAEKIIKKGLASKQKPDQNNTSGNSDDDNMIFNLSSKNKNPVMKALMTAIGYMIPITITGGILMAIPDVIAASGKGHWHFPNSFVAGWFQVGAIGLKLMLPIFAMYLAFAIAGRSAMPAGLIGTYLINDPTILKIALPKAITDLLDNLNHGSFNVQAGFLGAIAVGFFAGYLVKGMKWVNFPKILKPVVPIMIIPVLSTFITYVFVIYVAALPLTYIMSEFFIMLRQSSNASQIVLPLIGILFAAMIALDLGGPFNKTALLVGTAIYTSALIHSGPLTMPYADIVPQTATQAAISVPPLGAWMATLIFRKKFSVSERTTGKAAFGMGMVGISEGAIPFAITNPLRAVIANVVGASVAGLMVVLFGCRFVAGLGSPIGTFAGYIPGNVPYAGWIISVLSGALVTALIFGFSRPRVVEYEEAYIVEQNIKRAAYHEQGLTTKWSIFKFNSVKISKAVGYAGLSLINPKKWLRDPNLFGDPETYKINKTKNFEIAFLEKYNVKIENFQNINVGFEGLIAKDVSEKGKNRLIKSKDRNNNKLLKLEAHFSEKKTHIREKTANKINKIKNPETYKINKTKNFEIAFLEKYNVKIENFQNINVGFEGLIAKDVSEKEKKRLIKSKDRNNNKLSKLESHFGKKKTHIREKTANKINKIKTHYQKIQQIKNK